MIFLRCNFVNVHCGRHKILLILKRFAKNSKLKKHDPRTAALNHFDDFYKNVFNDRWPSIRLGLLSKQKLVAVLNNFGDVEETEKFLAEEGAFDLWKFLESQESETQKSDVKSEAVENKTFEKIIQEQVNHEMRELYPNEAEFLSRTDVLNQESKELDEGDVTCSTAHARSSLHSDLLNAQIDKSRLIQPEEGVAHISLQNFVPTTLLRGLEDYVPESEYYKYYQVQNDKAVIVEKEVEFEFPEKLKVFTFDRGDITEFPDPTKGSNDVYNFVTVDGSDFLTALALGVQPEDRVLDLCSLSGAMAYCIFQTLRPKVLICITSKESNTETLFRNSLYDYSPHWNEMLLITEKQLTQYENDQLFDRVLVHVPSTEDKASVTKMENNIFHPRRTRERLKLPEFQSLLLEKGLRLVRPGGAVVYSTATLSPIQNEAVVSRALTNIWATDKMEFVAKDLSPAFERFSLFFNFGDFLNMKYGTLIVPFAPSNFGPKYLCKLIKKETK